MLKEIETWSLERRFAAAPHLYIKKTRYATTSSPVCCRWKLNHFLFHLLDAICIRPRIRKGRDAGMNVDILGLVWSKPSCLSSIPFSPHNIPHPEKNRNGCFQNEDSFIQTRQFNWWNWIIFPRIWIKQIQTYSNT